MAGSVNIRSATSTDTPLLAAALTDVFAPDPYFQWLCPDPQRFRRLAPAAFGAQISREYIRRGTVELAELAGEVVGGILWRAIDPRTKHRGSLLAGWPWLRLCGRKWARLTSSNREFRRLHPGQPHLYLDTIGLIESARGHGIASGLLRPCLREADRGGFPVFLESTKIENLRVYQRFGFEPHVLVELPHGPNIWTMIRAPRPPAAA